MPDPNTRLPPWELPEETLLAQCCFEAFVGSGPGGQKRHKTNAAVRFTHLPTGISAAASDSRSQRENRIHALRALRHKLATEIRRELDLLTYVPPAWFAEYPGLHMSPKNPKYPNVIAEVLDVLKAMHWSVSRAAVMLGLTTSALTRFLHDDPPLWAKVNRSRTQFGMNLLNWK